MATQVKATKGAKYNLNHHLVWCPKFRRPVLTGKLQARMVELLHQIADKWEFAILTQEVMPDHIHLFVSVPPKYSPAEIARLFKGTSSRSLKQEFPAEIGKFIGKEGRLWSPSYDVGTAGNVRDCKGNLSPAPLEEGQEQHYLYAERSKSHPPHF